MSDLLHQASIKWAQGCSPANIARLLDIKYNDLMNMMADNPSVFTRRGDEGCAAYDPVKGRLPPKVPGSNGIPCSLIMSDQCHFPLWGDAEKPTAMSLMCGEPVERDGGCYCDYHHNLTYTFAPALEA